MTIDTKKFKSLKRKVLKKYPNASTRIASDGKYYVVTGNGGSIGSDFMIPNQDSVALAWYWASRSIQLKQNLDRTHPDRVAMSFDEKKFNRVYKTNRLYLNPHLVILDGSHNYIARGNRRYSIYSN